jgi:hypothetical protein
VWIAIGIAGIAAFFMYQKYQAYTSMDTGTPLLTLNRQYINYEPLHAVLGWQDISAIELHKERRTPKQATAAITHEEVRVNKKSGGYIVIDHAPFGVDAASLAESLEKYRAGL